MAEIAQKSSSPTSTCWRRHSPRPFHKKDEQAHHTYASPRQSERKTERAFTAHMAIGVGTSIAGPHASKGDSTRSGDVTRHGVMLYTMSKCDIELGIHIYKLSNFTCFYIPANHLHDDEEPPGFRCRLTLTILLLGLTFFSLLLITFGPLTVLAHIGLL